MPSFCLDPKANFGPNKYEEVRDGLHARAVLPCDAPYLQNAQRITERLAPETKFKVVGSIIYVACPSHDRFTVEATLSSWLIFMSPPPYYQFVTETEMEGIVHTTT